MEPRKSSNSSQAMPYLRAVCTTAASAGSSSVAAGCARRLNSWVARRCSRSARSAAVSVAVEVVEDVVGAPGEPVERVHRRTLLRGKQPRGQEERAPVLGVERAASAVGVAQGWIVDTRGVEFGTDHRLHHPVIGCRRRRRRR